jgi:hypothetical protein
MADTTIGVSDDARAAKSAFGTIGSLARAGLKNLPATRETFQMEKYANQGGEDE